MVPAAQEFQFENFQQQPFQPARIDEQPVRKHQHESQFQEIAGQRDSHQAARKHSGRGRNVEKFRRADDQYQQREHHDEIEFVEERGEHYDRRAAPDADPFFVDVDDRDAGAPDGRRRDRRRELPQHDDPERLPPRKLVVAEDADTDDVADVAAEHEHHGHNEPEHHVPRESDSGKHLDVEVFPQHVPYRPQSDEDRIESVRKPYLAQRAFRRMLRLRGIFGSVVHCLFTGCPGLFRTVPFY